MSITPAIAHSRKNQKGLAVLSQDYDVKWVLDRIEEHTRRPYHTNSMPLPADKCYPTLLDSLKSKGWRVSHVEDKRDNYSLCYWQVSW